MTILKPLYKVSLVRYLNLFASHREVLNFVSYSDMATMTFWSLTSLFLASLLGSSHCVGMCGGIVLLYSSSGEHRSSQGRKWLHHFLYNFGRLNSYLFLGGLAGFLGHSLDLASSAVGIGRVASIVFGGFLIFWGVAVLVRRRQFELPLPALGFLSPLYKSLGAGTGALNESGRAYLLGLLSTLLPCGWLYTFAAMAAATGGVLEGVVVMAVFWLGTLPYLVAVGVASQALLGPFRKQLPILVGILICLAGAFSIGQHLTAFNQTGLLSGTDAMGGADTKGESCH